MFSSVLHIGGPVNGVPTNMQQRTIMEEEGSDLLQMQTPPSKGKMKHPAAVAAAKKAIAAQQQESPAGVDKILAFSPPTKNEDVSEDFNFT